MSKLTKLKNNPKLFFRDAILKRLGIAPYKIDFNDFYRKQNTPKSIFKKKSIWLFASYKFQGNPKALFLACLNHSDKDCYWVAQNEEQKKLIKQLKIKDAQVVSQDSLHAQWLFSQADYLITENFREYYPETLNPNIIIGNLWHGVGLKNVELGMGTNLQNFYKGVAKKNIIYNNLYRNNTCFLVTSKAMQDHFAKSMNLSEDQFIKANYPRNYVYRDLKIKTFDNEHIQNKNLNNYNDILLFAPTFRKYNQHNIFNYLIPNIEKLTETLKRTNSLLIIKVHPSMEKDFGYQELLSSQMDNKHLLFWQGENDIYEIFHKIDKAIIDYSSIFYDLLDAGVKSFIRYIPDFQKMNDSENFTHDYYEYTLGDIATNFEQLLDLITNSNNNLESKDMLMDYFFGYGLKNKNSKDINFLVEQIESFKPRKKVFKELHTFDIFDTLIKRKCTLPKGIFIQIQDDLKRRYKDQFSTYFIENYCKIRMDAEANLRAAYKVMQYERQSDKNEITFLEIFERISLVFNLNEEQKKLLMQLEIHYESINLYLNHEMMNILKDSLLQGNDVMLISDMYLSKKDLLTILIKLDPIFKKLPLFLSSEIGYQKIDSKLYQYIFFDSNYSYSKWVHYGDNKHSDGIMARSCGIETRTIDVHRFTRYEQYLLNNMQNSIGYDLSSHLLSYRQSCIDITNMEFDEIRYFSYAYLGLWLVPYIQFCLIDTLEKGYKTLYFISRDGHYLKQIADILISEQHLNIKTKYIYGSRKIWRFAINEDRIPELLTTFFGVLGGVSSFDEVVRASKMDEETLLNTVPSLIKYKNIEKYTKEIRENIGYELLNSPKYYQFIKDYCKEKHDLTLKYVEQQIDFSEKFAFIEYWGRGYTQNILTDLINEIKPNTENPFYYIRSIYGSEGKNVRHHFLTKNITFWFVEPFFSNISYLSIEDYFKNDNGEVKPVINNVASIYEKDITNGLHDITSYLAKIFHKEKNTKDLCYSLADHAFQYFINTPQDAYIGKVFSLISFDHGMFNENNIVAPPLTKQNIDDLTIMNQSDITLSLPISLANSPENVRNLYKKNYPKAKLPPLKDGSYPFNPLNRYLSVEKLPLPIIVLQEDNIHFDVSWKYPSKEKIKPNQILLVKEVLLTNTGVPRFLIPNGFITAHKAFVQELRSITIPCNTTIYKNEKFKKTKILTEDTTVAIVSGFYKNNIPYLKTEIGIVQMNNCLSTVNI